MGAVARLTCTETNGGLMNSFSIDTGFFGFISAEPVAYIVLTGQPDQWGNYENNGPVLDNFAFASTPEPATFAVCMIGLAVFAIHARWRRLHPTYFRPATR